MRSTTTSMWRYVLVPIHQEGWSFVAICLALAATLFFVWTPLGWLGLALTLACTYFFRNPDRVTPVRDGLIISGADGMVEAIAPATPPPEIAMDPAPVVRVSVFLSLLDVHVARSPVAGTVIQRVHVPGIFLNAALDRASDENERLVLRIGRDGEADIAVVLIAGQVARRIRGVVEIGDTLRAGQRIGLIRFGSRVDVYLPPGVEALVGVGQHMVGGETVLADSQSSEPARTCEVH